MDKTPFDCGRKAGGARHAKEGGARQFNAKRGTKPAAMNSNQVIPAVPHCQASVLMGFDPTTKAPPGAHNCGQRPTRKASRNPENGPGMPPAETGISGLQWSSF